MFDSQRRSTILFLFLIAVFLYFQLFRFPATPILFEGDHAVYLGNAWRMFQGETAFKDFFLFQFPGTEVFYLFFFNLFGVKIWILNWVILFLLLSLSALGLYFSRAVLSGAAIYLPTAVFVVAEFRILGIDGSHRYFSVAFVFLAVAVLLAKRSFQRLFWAGFFCGVASCFTQPRGLAAIAGVILFLVVEKFYERQDFKTLAKSIFWLCLPFAFLLLASSLYFIWSAGFENYYFAAFVFPVKHYPADPLNNPRAYMTDFPIFENLSLVSILKQAAPRIFNYLLIPLVYLIFFALLLFKGKAIPQEKKLQLILLNTVGLLLGVAVLSAPSAIRLYQVSLPGLISLVWIFQNSPRVPKIIFSIALAGLGLLGAAYSIQRAVVPVYRLQTPSGEIASLTSENLSRYKWAAQNTAPDDFLYEPHHPSLYMMFHLKNPTPLPLVRPNDYTTDAQVADIVKGLERKQPRFIIWNGLWESYNPAQSPGFHLEPLVKYVHKNYHPVDNLIYDSQPENKRAEEYKVEIWEKNFADDSNNN